MTKKFEYETIDVEDKMKRYKETVAKLDNVITVLVDCDEADLNDPTQFDGHTDSDKFLRKVHEHFGAGTKVLHLYACYYQGWEMDNWAAMVSTSNDGIVYVSTTHGVLQSQTV